MRAMKLFQMLPSLLVLAPVAAFGVHCSSEPTAATTDGGANGSVVDASSQCAPTTGPGTTHTGTTITASETWTAAGSPHVVTFSTIIEAAATLTIEPCTVVRIDGGYGLHVRGKLAAKGTSAAPILFEASEAAKPFGALHIDGGTLDLAYTTVRNGGAISATTYGMIDLRGEGAKRRDAFLADHVTIAGSATFGLSLRGDAAVAASSQNLTISGAAAGPVRATAKLAGSLPSGVYTGNGTDEIFVDSATPMDESTRYPARGVPYRIGTLTVGETAKDAPEVAWTVDPGVNIRVSSAGNALLNSRRTTASPDVDTSNGTLIAIGTAAAPITFEGATATAGSWRGIVFRAAPTAASRLDYVTVAHAGGPSQANSFHCDPAGKGAFSKNEDAALALYGAPTSPFVTHATFRDSAGDGIDHAYSGTMVDLLPSNTFSALAGCKQTRPRNADGSCPDAGYCP
jgi:hypothetical protein